MSERGRGHIPDVFDERDWSAIDLPALVSAAHLPKFVDLSAHVDQIRNQGATGSCVGQACARFIHMRASIMGLPVPFPSALGIYALARRDDPKLLDVDCRPRDAVQGMQLFGIVSEDRWPFDPTRVVGEKAKVPWDVLTAGYDARLEGYYRVTGKGETRCDLVRRALAAGYPITFAQRVDEQFDAYSGGVLGPFAGEDLGGHFTNLIGYSIDDGWFLGLNSWGTGWGDGGFYRVSAERVGSDFCSDFLACTLAPRGVR